MRLKDKITVETLLRKHTSVATSVKDIVVLRTGLRCMIGFEDQHGDIVTIRLPAKVLRSIAKVLEDIK